MFQIPPVDIGQGWDVRKMAQAPLQTLVPSVFFLRYSELAAVARET
jgi:hypothetical protein